MWCEKKYGTKLRSIEYKPPWYLRHLTGFKATLILFRMQIGMSSTGDGLPDSTYQQGGQYDHPHHQNYQYRKDHQHR